MRLGVPVMVSVIIGVSAGLTATPGATQELRGVCDAGAEGTLTAEEAQGCAEQGFDLARGAADGLAEEQFAAALPNADGLRQQFRQVDQDGDGRISREEWMRSFGPAHAETTNGAVGRHSGSDQLSSPGTLFR
jgi:hypothetical protein